jgi:hypothetical protein
MQASHVSHTVTWKVGELSSPVKERDRKPRKKLVVVSAGLLLLLLLLHPQLYPSLLHLVLQLLELFMLSPVPADGHVI